MKTIEECRCCGNKDLIKYIDLGSMPLANNLCETFEESLHAKRYPLQVMLCRKCGLSQLSIVIDPSVLFSHYVYRSSVNQGYVDHCREMAKTLRDKYGLSKDSVMIDIAGNDGALLKEFRDEIGLRVLNIDPAVNLSAFNDAKRIRILNEFWSVKTVGKLEGYGKADLITATNVFAHVDDVHDFMHACYLELKDTGTLVLEFPYLIDFIEKNEFDTIYFEHLSYFSIKPLIKIAEVCKLFVNDITHFDIHGGTVRVELSKQDKRTEAVDEYIKRERDYSKIDTYIDYEKNVRELIKDYNYALMNIPHPKYKFAAFGASAKGNTFLNTVGNHYRIDYIVDETPEKIGKYSPGTGKPVVDMAELIRLQPDYLIILAWNFADEIIKRCKDKGYKGKFIIPIPKFTIVE